MLTPIELEKAQTFWKWFEKNRYGFEFLSEIDNSQKNELMNACTFELNKFSVHLNPIFSPEISNKGGLRFIVSAAGNPNYFQLAKDLAALAPEVPGWNIVGLIQPYEKGMEVRFTVSNIVLDPKELGVALADIGDQPNHLAVLVGLREYDADQPQLMANVRSVAVQLVSNLCGEEMVGYDIQYLDLRPLPDDPGAHGFHRMFNLPDLIIEYREECPRPVINCNED